MRLIALFAAGTLATLTAVNATAQQNVNVRGAIQSFEGGVLTVAGAAGSTTRVHLPDNIGVSITRPFSMADLKPGMKLGVTTIQRDGGLIAIDVRPIPAAAKPGLSPYDLQPQSTMTNATLEGIVAGAGMQEITLNHGGGTVTVRVPADTPMSQAAPGARSDLKPGETVFVAARRDETGNLVAIRVQVSKDGVKPTQ